MPTDALEVLERAEQNHQQWRDCLRPVAGWFHDREGEMFERSEARDRIADDLTLDEELVQSTLAGLVGDDVDPIVQAMVGGEKYVGVAEFEEFDGAYGYLDYHDTLGQRRRVICAQCVHESEYDYEVAHATAGDPEGSFGPDASYGDLLAGVHDHYEGVHDTEPETVETGASLVSGTTIGGNTVWHSGNDGGGTGLHADLVDGKHASDLGSAMQWNFLYSNTKTDETTTSSINTGTLTQYDQYKLIIYWQNYSSNYGNVELQANGITASDYETYYQGGSGVSSSTTSFWRYVARTSTTARPGVANLIVTNPLITGSTSNNSSEESPHVLGNSGGSGRGTQFIHGALRQDEVVLNSFQAETNQTGPLHMEVYGRNLQ